MFRPCHCHIEEKKENKREKNNVSSFTRESVRWQPSIFQWKKCVDTINALYAMFTVRFLFEVAAASPLHITRKREKEGLNAS